jgi:hypothetical protein
MSDRERKRRSAQSRRDRDRNGSFTVSEWCAFRRVSRAMLYKLWAANKGPQSHRVGVKRLISAEADARWVADSEAEAAA